MKSKRVSEREGEEVMKRASGGQVEKRPKTDLSVSTYGRQSQKNGMIFGGPFL